MDAPECHHFQNGGLSRNEFDKLDGGDFIIDDDGHKICMLM